MNKQLQKKDLSIRELSKILFNTLKDENKLAIKMIVRNYNNNKQMEKKMEQFNTWLQTAQSNDRFVYYEGYFAKDRHMSNNKKEINAVGNSAYQAYENKLVVLFQKRVSYGDTQKDPVFKYIAQKI
jgi:hypothetical protein